MHYDFRGFMSQFSMTVEVAQRVFGVSRRTVIRWRQTGRISPTAERLARSIERQAAPFNATFGRSWYYGLSLLPYEWRLDLFGADWRTWRPAAVAERERRDRRAAHLAYNQALERAQERARKRQKRKARHSAGLTFTQN